MPEVLRPQRPFWIHQLVEYLIGIMLISFALRTLEPALPAIMGVLIMLNAAVATGGAGAFRLVSPRLHKTLDVVMMLLLLVAAFQPWISVDNVARLMLGAMAFVLLFIWFHTDFTTRRERKANKTKPTSEEIGRTAGRVIGNSMNSVRNTWRSMTDDESASDEKRS
jgi:uncharacterized membrane protein YhaH (DUF805 family)